MAYNNLAELFTAIANAIRGKTGSADPIVANDFPTAIEGISGGDHSMEDGLISGTITEYRNDRVESVAAYTFYRDQTLETITLPNVKTVLAYAFAGANKLKIVDLHTATSLEAEAFNTNDEDTALKHIVIRSETAATTMNDEGSAFDMSPNYDLLVPRALITAYKNQRFNDFGVQMTTITVLALEDYTVDGTVTGELDLTKLEL